MFKLVVLFALVAIAAAKPSGIVGYSAIAAPAVAVPAAVSHQYRTDVISKPVVATYASAPVVARTVVAAAPAVYAAAAPAVYAAAAPAVYSAAAPVAYASPLAHAW